MIKKLYNNALKIINLLYKQEHCYIMSMAEMISTVTQRWRTCERNHADAEDGKLQEEKCHLSIFAVLCEKCCSSL